MQTADNVARWILSRNKVRELGGEADLISNLKLQKLLYYAQGMYLALYDEPLFADEIVAWRHGPVVESVFDKYKVNGSDAIKTFEPPEENFTDDEEFTLQIAQEAFGQFSAWKLADMVHTETPWQETPLNEIITRDKIQRYFSANYIEGGD